MLILNCNSILKSISVISGHGCENSILLDIFLWQDPHLSFAYILAWETLNYLAWVSVQCQSLRNLFRCHSGKPWLRKFQWWCSACSWGNLNRSCTEVFFHWKVQVPLYPLSAWILQKIMTVEESFYFLNRRLDWFNARDGLGSEVNKESGIIVVFCWHLEECSN